MRRRAFAYLQVSILLLLLLLGRGCGARADLSAGQRPGGSVTAGGVGGGHGGGGGHAGGGGVGGAGGGVAGGGGGFSGGGGGFAGGGGVAAGGGGEQLDATAPSAVGTACFVDQGCTGVAAGMVGRCSLDSFNNGPLYPDAVCIAFGCTITNPAGVTYCDGAAGTGSSSPSGAPGICIQTNGTGNICLPLCTFDDTGAVPAGCVGRDACNPYAFNPNSTGDGYCLGGCTQDSDCTKDSPSAVCQTESGLCVNTTIAFAKTIGQSCTNADYDVTSGCICDFNTTTSAGYCSQFCTQGGSPCPGGYVCDSLVPGPLSPINDGGNGFGTEPQGLAGLCTATCIPADAGADAGACPPNSTCSSVDLAGPDCQP